MIKVLSYFVIVSIFYLFEVLQFLILNSFCLIYILFLFNFLFLLTFFVSFLKIVEYPMESLNLFFVIFYPFLQHFPNHQVINNHLLINLLVLMILQILLIPLELILLYEQNFVIYIKQHIKANNNGELNYFFFFFEYIF